MDHNQNKKYISLNYIKKNENKYMLSILIEVIKKSNIMKILINIVNYYNEYYNKKSSELNINYELGNDHIIDLFKNSYSKPFLILYNKNIYFRHDILVNSILTHIGNNDYKCNKQAINRIILHYFVSDKIYDIAGFILNQKFNENNSCINKKNKI